MIDEKKYVKNAVDVPFPFKLDIRVMIIQQWKTDKVINQ